MVETTAIVKNLTQVQYDAIYRPAFRLPTIEELIESRIARLTSLGLATETDLRTLAGHITSRNFAFVPAWPDLLDFRRWMALTKYKGHTGENHLTPHLAHDLVVVPQGPFVMLDVQDGYARRDTAPSISAERINTERRTPFTVRMGISYLGELPCAVDLYGMDLVGSQYDARKVPVLCIDAGTPALTCREQGQAAWNRGAPSCGAVVGLNNRKETLYGRDDHRSRPDHL